MSIRTVTFDTFENSLAIKALKERIFKINSKLSKFNVLGKVSSFEVVEVSKYLKSSFT